MVVEAGPAEEQDTPIYKDRLGNIVDEENVAGYKVTHNLVKPEM